MNNDPVAALLDADSRRATSATDLGRAHAALARAVVEYRQAWKSATAAGWARTDLVRAGLTDPSRLPRTQRPRSSEPDADAGNES